MNREEAKQWLEAMKSAYALPIETYEAIDMAIEALQTDTVMRNATAEERAGVQRYIDSISTEAVQVVRCKDCKWRIGIYCDHEDGMVSICDDDFCSCGERKNPENG